MGVGVVSAAHGLGGACPRCRCSHCHRRNERRSRSRNADSETACRATARRTSTARTRAAASSTPAGTAAAACATTSILAGCSAGYDALRQVLLELRRHSGSVGRDRARRRNHQRAGKRAST